MGLAENCNLGSATMVNHMQVPRKTGEENCFVEGKRKLGGQKGSFLKEVASDTGLEGQRRQWRGQFEQRHRGRSASSDGKKALVRGNGGAVPWWSPARAGRGGS